MVRRHLIGAVIGLAAFAATGCSRDRDMAEAVEMPDTMPAVRAMDDPAARDAMLDTMPGGEMARGDSSAAMRLLRDKVEH